MAHDLIFWCGSPTQPPAEVWERLADGKPVAFVEPLGRLQVRAAFEAEFGAELGVEEDLLFGPGFELQLLDGAHYLLLSHGPGAALERIHRARERLGCHAYDPEARQHHEPPAPSSSRAPELSASGLHAGDVVRHAKFGGGRVVAVDGVKLTVRFEDGSERRLLASFVSASA